MQTNFAKELWQVYPNCRLHVEVLMAGLNSYEVEVTVLDADKKLLHKLEYFGTGDLFEVKREAIQSLLRQVLEVPSA